MSVYVDDMRAPYGRMLMSHMIADTLAELHGMAVAIGVDGKWFQNHGHPHYDIAQSKRAMAIRRGAIPITQRELVLILRRQNADLKTTAQDAQHGAEGQTVRRLPCWPGYEP